MAPLAKKTISKARERNSVSRSHAERRGLHLEDKWHCAATSYYNASGIPASRSAVGTENARSSVAAKTGSSSPLQTGKYSTLGNAATRSRDIGGRVPEERRGSASALVQVAVRGCGGGALRTENAKRRTAAYTS